MFLCSEIFLTYYPGVTWDISASFPPSRLRVTVPHRWWLSQPLKARSRLRWWVGSHGCATTSADFRFQCHNCGEGRKQWILQKLSVFVMILLQRVRKQFSSILVFSSQLVSVQATTWRDPRARRFCTLTTQAACSHALDWKLRPVC